MSSASHSYTEVKCANLGFQFNSQLLNEIMPMIYKRFTEKSAEEWRQIYKVRPLYSGHRMEL